MGEVLAIKRVANVRLGKMVQPNPATETDVEANYLRAAHVQPAGRLVDAADKVMWFSPAELRDLNLITGDVVVVEGGAGYGRSALIDSPMDGWGYQNSIVRVRPRTGLSDGRFLNYVFQSLLSTGETALAASVATIPHYTADKVGATRHWVPSVETQTVIADFLDRETAQIDAMIEAQEELVKTLTARRALSITNAVSFGLNGAELQDTGIPWLGQAPTHWEVRPLKHLGRAIIGLTYAPENIVDECDDGTLVLRAGNIQGGQLDYGDCVFVDAAIPPIKRLRDRDLLICSRNGSARLIGKSALIHGRSVGQTWGAFMTVFRSPVNDYLYWVLNSALFERQLGLFATSTINQLTTGMLHNMRIAVPPRDEQVRIITQIETAVAKVDEVLREAGKTVSLLRERREALITAAVTGRIDPKTGIERVDQTTEKKAS